MDNMSNGSVGCVPSSFTVGSAYGYNYIQATNDQVAVTPFPKSDAPTQITKSGFTRDVRKGSLVALQVVYGTFEYAENTTVYVRSDNVIHPWAKEVFELDGKSFIIIPKSAILLRRNAFPSTFYPATFAAAPAPALPVLGTGERWEFIDGQWRKVK